ncbi:MAG: hypothetical protein GY820_11325 [Gammaproteobacteria bacterium]|nr:hypothetical protein [Gammaproteobacteria bacterium]
MLPFKQSLCSWVDSASRIFTMENNIRDVCIAILNNVSSISVLSESREEQFVEWMATEAEISVSMFL